MTSDRRPLSALRAALRRAADAYAATAWVYRYGPGFAPTGPVYVAGEAGAPAASGALNLAPNAAARVALGAARPQAPASRSPAHASASA